MLLLFVVIFYLFFFLWIANRCSNTTWLLSLSLIWVRIPSRVGSDLAPGSRWVRECRCAYLRQLQRHGTFLTGPCAQQSSTCSINTWYDVAFLWTFAFCSMHAYCRLHIYFVCYTWNKGTLSTKKGDAGIIVDSSKQHHIRQRLLGGLKQQTTILSSSNNEFKDNFYVQNSMQNFISDTPVRT